jgi:serine/threonine-protein kinase
MAGASRHRSASRPRLEVGRKVDGYRIHRIVDERPGLQTLAEGVNRGGEHVTLDVIATPLSADRELRRRLARLVPTRRSIHHPNMLRLLRSVDEGQRLHLQALPPGAATLAERLRVGRPPPKQALTLLGQVAGALETARGRGLVHRQLSPRAIFVTAADPPEALLTDFGIGAPRARACELAAAVEDAPYRSPEEIRGEQPDARSNVYSLACILAECLTAEPPYAHDRPLLTLQAHLTEPPPRLSEREPELPEALDEVMTAALAKDPRERQASPGALMRAAEAALDVRVPIPIVRERKEPRAAVVPAPAVPAPPARPASEAKPPAHAGRRRIAAGRRRIAAGGRRVAVLVPRGAGALAALFLVASAAGGFAAGTSGGTEQSATRAPAAAPAPAAETVSSPSVDGVVKRLNARRASARHRLRAADTPEEQAAAAQALENAYRDAYEELGAVSGARAELAERLQAVAESYGLLVSAARGEDADTWRATRERTLDSERDLELMLRNRPWT